MTRCSLCNELITAQNPGQFFPEDDSYICGICQKEHQRTLEKIGSHSHKMDSRTWAADAFVTKSPDIGKLKSAVGRLLEVAPN